MRVFYIFFLILASSLGLFAQCPLTATTSVVDADCGANGSITINVSNGQGAILYEITDGPVTTSSQASNVFESLVAGTYQVTVKSGCPDLVIDNLVISSDYEQLQANTVTISPPSCPNGSDGSFIVTGLEGKEPYQYQIISPTTSAVQTSGTFSNLSEGAYQVRVTDACGNFVTRVVNLPDSPFDNISLSLTSTTDGCSTAGLNGTASGGSEPYTYELLDGNNNVIDTNSTGEFNNLSISSQNTTTYKVRVTDACNQRRTRVRRFNPPSISPTVQYRCGSNGESFHRIRPRLSLSPQPLPIVWTVTDADGNSQTKTQTTNTSKFFDLAEVGTYTIEGQTTGCGTVTRTVNVGTDSPFDFSVENRNPEACENDEGRIRINYGATTGGTPQNALYELVSGPSSFGPYPKTVSRTFSAPPGNYSIKVSNRNGNRRVICDSVTKNFTISANDLYEFSLAANAESGCPGANEITANATITNGSSQVLYELLDTSGNVIASNNSGVFNNNIAPGAYQVRASPTNSACNVSEVVDVNVEGYVFPSLTGSRATICDDNTTTLSALVSNGVAPYQYQIKPATAPDSDYSALQNDPVFEDLQIGTYDVRVIDACGNSAITQLSAAALINPTVDSEGRRCLGESFNFSAPFVPGATYQWTTPARGVVNDRTLTLNNLTQADDGTYDLLFTISGCTSVIQSVDLEVQALPETPSVDNINQCDIGTYALNGSLGQGESGEWTVIAEPNVGDATIADTQNPNSNITIGAKGLYTLRWTVTNADGCSSSIDKQFTFDCTLPVELLYFNAYNQGQDVVLDWETLTEIDNDYFNIEYSIDGTHFKSLAIIKGQGTVSNATQYQYLHKNIHNLNTDILFYRLAQVDYNGETNYSPVQVVKLHTQKAIIYPNPIENNDFLTIEYPDIRRISIYNNVGALVDEVVLDKRRNKYSYKPTLSSGIYIVKINNTHNFKLIKYQK